MPAHILQIETAVPEHAYTQDFASERMQSWAASERDRRIVRQVYRHSGIGRRYSVCGDFLRPEGGALFPTGPDGRPVEAGTEARNDLYLRESRRLGVEAAARTLAACPGVRREEITHVVTASCTGFGNPGLDYHLVVDLGLRPTVERYHLGFMGCYAAFPALRMAARFCEADPNAVVLVECLELCSLHLRPGGGTDNVLANAIFADGAACALVHARPDWARRSMFRLDGFSSGLAVAGRGDMAWSIGDHGFNIVLSSYVPDLIAANIGELVDSALRAAGVSRRDVGFWAVHPGGKAILDKIEKALDLPGDALRIPREVLERYGNMSSATILFVLKEIAAASGRAPGQPVCGMAFGPGLTLELAILRAEDPA